MIHVVDPRFSRVPEDEARRFLKAAMPLLETVPVSSLGTLESLAGCEPGAADGVVFFNPMAAEAGAEVEALLARAVEAGAVVLPIALREEWRSPPSPAGVFQSFDLVDQLRRRALSPEQVSTAAGVFAREALSRVQPTFNRDRLRLFLCHRREDGEGLTAAIGAKLDVLHEGPVFRDLIDVQVGEQAQERIDAALESADAVVFIDTPKAGESWWIVRELSAAMGRNLPIVWVRVGGSESRPSLPVPPLGEPQIEVPETELEGEALRELADRILETAYDASRSHVRHSLAALDELRRWAGENGAELETLDPRRMIYELRHPPVSGTYPTRPATDIVQFFGHHPTGEDHERLEAFLERQGLGPHERECRSFDAALLLDPVATGVQPIGDWSIIEEPGRYLQHLHSGQAENPDGAPTMLLLGAFPDDPLAQQQVKEAVHAGVATWLRLGGSIAFGGHPTITPLVIEAGRLIVPGHERERLTVFQSRWYASPDALEELTELADVVAVDPGADRASSLTAMRTLMCGIGADAVVAIGGRTDEGGTHVPGVDEEVRLARVAGSPVFILGGPGGRAAELALAASREDRPWNSLGNPLSEKENHYLFDTAEYEQAMRLIHSSLDEV